MKRSPRDGRWADGPSARVRFAFEAVFLILVAVGAALMDLEPLTIVLLMACAWILVTLIERASFREAMEPPAENADEEALPAAPEPAPEASPREPLLRRFWRRGAPREEKLPSPTAALEERPSRSHVRRIEAEPRAGDGEVAAEAPPEPEPVPGTAVTTWPLDLPGLEQAAASSAPSRPRRSLTRAAKRVVSQPPPAEPPPPPPAREWNLWDLERRAREQAPNEPRAEEWSALFTHLRVFANADGVLPKEFDALVRESFGELIEAA